MIIDCPDLLIKAHDTPWLLTDAERAMVREATWLEEQLWLQSIQDAPPYDGPPLEDLEGPGEPEPIFEPSDQDRIDWLVMRGEIT